MIPGRTGFAALLAWIGATLILPAQVPARACGPSQPTPVTDLGERYPFGQVYNPADQQDFSLPEDDQSNPIKYFRVLITVRNAEHGRWFLTVRDRDFHVAEVLSGADFTQSRSRWSTRVKGPRVRLDFDNVENAGDVMFIIDEYIVMRDTNRSYYNFPPGAPQSVSLYHNSNVDVTDAIRRLGDFTGFLMSSYGRASWSCSGVAVALDLILTNWHCGAPPDSAVLESAYWKTNCPATLIDMSWDDDGVSHEYRCVSVEDKDIDLDFALLRVEPVGEARALRPAPINRALPANGRVTVIHHPAAAQKQVSANCKVIDAAYESWHDHRPDVDFTHRCHTEPGSSGAPVFNDRGEVVGLHHWGFKYDEEACAYADTLNKAVHIDRIVDHIRHKSAALAAPLRVVSSP